VVGIRRKNMNQAINNLFKNIPLRIAITNYCNLNCFFCSNEGMAKDMRNNSFAKLEDLKYLINLLKLNGLEQISLTGGDPSCYANLKELISFINELKFKKTFFHTNGVFIDKELIFGELKKFDKIAISIHTLDAEEWKKMTFGKISQFNSLINNLELFHKEGYSSKIEIKIIPIKGYNDSEESIKKILDFCSDRGFKFKFLILEPIERSHKELVVSLEKMNEMLISIGASPKTKEDLFRGQKEYLPINRYSYKKTEGVLIEIGCGKEKICKSCAGSNEIFLTSNLEIKPCHLDPYLLSLMENIKEKNEQKIINSILDSRIFLKTNPGENKTYWREK
jgi:cyclic pyranopterin phosphate synthase